MGVSSVARNSVTKHSEQVVVACGMVVEATKRSEKSFDFPLGTYDIRISRNHLSVDLNQSEFETDIFSNGANMFNLSITCGPFGPL